MPKLTKVDWTDIQFNTLKKRFLLPTEKKEALFYTKGGIYADEMGLGKTITMLSLVLANPLDLTRPPAVDDSHFVTKATLVPAHAPLQAVHGPRAGFAHCALSCAS